MLILDEILESRDEIRMRLARRRLRERRETLEQDSLSPAVGTVEKVSPANAGEPIGGEWLAGKHVETPYALKALLPARFMSEDGATHWIPRDDHVHALGAIRQVAEEHPWETDEYSVKLVSAKLSETDPDGWWMECERDDPFAHQFWRVIRTGPKRLWWDDYGHVVQFVHAPDACVDEFCSIHNPSVNSLSGCPQLWRHDRGLMERTCKHGIGHPDPDHVAFTKRIRGQSAAEVEYVHGCCGECCTGSVERRYKYLPGTAMSS